MDSQPIRSVLIVGGGLGGLALAQALRNTNIQVTIFERDIDPGARQQGYILGVNADGEAALRKLQIPPLTTFLDGDESKRFRSFSLSNDSYKILMQFPFGGKGKGCLIDRWQLRELLMHEIGESKNIRIVWGKKFVKYEENDNEVAVIFEDGTSAKGDVLVGADGSRSLVRAQRTSEIVYEPLPVANVGAFVRAPARPDMAKLQDTFDTCLLRVFGTEGVSLLAMPFISREDHSDLIVYSLTFPCTDPLTQDDITQVLLERAAKVNPDSVELIRSTPRENFLSSRKVHSCRLLSKDPLGKTTRVTLLGDAAHAMTSHAGLGGNTAFLDALDLAKALSAPNWHSEMAKYEKAMIKRGFDNVNTSIKSTNMITKPSGEKGAVIRNWMMWTIGRFVGGEAKVEK